MVAPNKRAGAIAMMFAGLTIANVLGVPFGTLLGQQLGWRSTFWAITVIGVIALIGIAALVPDGQPASTTGGGLRGELGAFRNKQVWLSIVITILGYGGMFGAFTYIAFTLTEVTGFATSSVPWLLIPLRLGPVRRQLPRRQGGRPFAHEGAGLDSRDPDRRSDRVRRHRGEQGHDCDLAVLHGRLRFCDGSRSADAGS